MHHTIKALTASVGMLAFLTGAQAQIRCVKCVDQNEPIYTGALNLVQNGSFENGPCQAGEYYCPLSWSYQCDLANWSCTGGESSTYASVFSSAGTVTGDGDLAIYLGNAFAGHCGATQDDTTCFESDGCVTVGIPPGYPQNSVDYGGPAGVSVEQTVSGLTVGAIYTLEFWSGGESGFTEPGVFGVDIGFGYTYLRCVPTDLFAFPVGRRYQIIFNATSTSHTLKFTNWGHPCWTCTETVLDDIRLYPGEGAIAEGFVVTLDDCANTVTCSGPGTNTLTYSWDMGDGTTLSGNTVTHTYAAANTYTITITGSDPVCGTSASSSQTITIEPTVGFDLGFSAVQLDPCRGLAVLFDNQSTGPANSTYSWSFGDGFTGQGDTITHSYAQPGSYPVTITGLEPDCGLSAQVTSSVEVLTPPFEVATMALPNVFSPNGDLKNDTYFPITNAGDQVKLSIWNRFGQRIYTSPNEYRPWDGKKEGDLVPEGVYFLLLEYDFNCVTGAVHGQRSGTVQVLR